MAPVVKVYGPAKSWNIARVAVTLEEAGVEYEVVAVDFAAGDQAQEPAHLARNPFGQVPVLQDGDFGLWGRKLQVLLLLRYCFVRLYNSLHQYLSNMLESRAITKYVCRKHKPKLLTAGNLEQSAMVDLWLEVEAHEYGPVIEAILKEVRLRPIFGQPIDEKAVDEHIEKLKRVLHVYEARLSMFQYLAGDFISLADLNHVSTMLCLVSTRYASVLDEHLKVKAWWDNMTARPAVTKVAELMEVSLLNDLK